MKWLLLLSAVWYKGFKPVVKFRKYSKSTKSHFEMSDSHDGCTESGLKVQSCDGALNELAAYKNAAY